jgi:ABC-type dipeptide/oligopeptide/nickel transport system permease component
LGFKRYLAMRIAAAVVTFFTAVILTFVLFRLLPGNPTAMFVDPELPPDVRAKAIEQLGLAQPAPQQFVTFMVGIFKGNLGSSFNYRQPVWDVLYPRMLNTLALALTAAIITFSLAIFLGRYAGLREGKRLDRIMTTIISGMGSIPLFVLGLLAILILAIETPIFPYGLTHSIGFSGTGLEYYFSSDYVYHLLLPALTLGASNLIFYYLIVRNATVSVNHSEFIDYLRARGAGSSLIHKHVTRNILLPLSTVIANYFAFALGGQIVIEIVFSWLGLGFTIVRAINGRDFPLAQGAFLLISAVAVAMMFISDLIYGLVDPRVRYR